MKPVIPSVRAQDEEDLVDPQQTLRVLVQRSYREFTNLYFYISNSGIYAGRD